MQKIVSRSPGEIFFFGEHSVVYGRRAVVAAIDRWITTTLTKNNDGYVQINSSLGTFKAKLHGLRLEVIKADVHLAPFAHGIERIYKRFGDATGFTAVIESELPVNSGLASSAASSASLLGGVIALMDKALTEEDMVHLVFRSEIDIQKIGSISGSACTVLRGVVGIMGNKFNRLEDIVVEPDVIIADSKESVPTSESTGCVKDMLYRKELEVQEIFDVIHSLATKGEEALRKKDWQILGVLMNENQSCLKQLGVSTRKIDSAIESIKLLVYGSKITGAGGGGCFVSLCNKEQAPEVVTILKEQGFNAYSCRICTAGNGTG
ncbi:MAG: mevalonate kinase [Parcubacteria group bacterium]|jgi:mevalonate kinase|nr:mevalonate kinase [Parcubacteria group bacterium]